MTDPVPADLEQRIRDRAYYLWEQAGRPEGGAEEFWHQARAAETEGAAAPVGPDEARMESFPASDPPAISSITGAGAVR